MSKARLLTPRGLWHALAAPVALAAAVAAGCAGGGGGGGAGTGNGSGAVTKSGGGNLTVLPQYQPSPQVQGISGNKLPVSVKVTDQRKFKGEVRSDGRELIAQGDKGKVYLDKTVTKVFEDALTRGLQASGFTVRPDAPVVVEATVVDLPLQAWQFTHWGLPSERASTLDAFAAVVPGPVRQTAAKTALNVVVRRADARLGYTHTTTKAAANTSKDPAVVAQTLSEVVGGAVNDALAKAAPDVEIVTRAPATTREIDNRTGEIDRQRKLLDDVAKTLAAREATLNGDRQALDEMRRRLEDDRRQVQLAAQTDRATIEKERKELSQQGQQLAQQQQALKQEQQKLVQQRTQLAAGEAKLAEERSTLAAQRKDVESKIQEMNARPDPAPAAREALAALKRQQAELAKQSAALDARAKQAQADAAANQKRAAAVEAKAAELAAKARELTGTAGDVEQRRTEVAEREQNLQVYAARLDEQSKANQTLSADLRLRQRELEDQDAALRKWRGDLEARASARPPQTIVQPRKPIVVVTDPPASRRDTTLPRITVSGVASDDRKIAALRAIVNGRPIDLMAPAQGTRAVNVRLLTPERLNEIAGGGRGTTKAAGQAAPGPATAPASVASEQFAFTAELTDGTNDISVEATDDEGLATAERFTINYTRGTGRVIVVAIGVNDYQNSATVPALQYAVSDAKGVADTFSKVIATPDKRVREFLNEQASRDKLTDHLFYQLPAEVRPEDTVIIFFSGHGAPDTVTDAQGNVETFLLPIDADPSKLFTTAIRMSDVGTMLRRMRSERIVFLADTCYSGAAAAGGEGARTVGVPGVALRAVGVRSLPKRPEGKGCAVITASTGTEVAQERKELGHGIFSHYVLQGLKGAADADRNSAVTVDELYAYVKQSVGEATKGSQTPQISRDPSAGEIILSRVAK